ncbi:MAG: hypothetical protein QOE59_2487 [Actinomycetota bacterium]|nr:hypothetical protein [Actinomycetota bacterium]
MATILRRIIQALVVVTLVALAGAALMGAPRMVIPAVVLGALAGIVAYVVALGPTAPPPAAQATARARAWRLGAVVALVALAVSGTAVLLGDATGPVLLFAALVVIARSWSRVRPAAAWIRARTVARSAPAATATDRRPTATTPPQHGATLSTCGTAALRATWQRSYHHLREVADEAELDALLDLRRRCLDEFERRDPAGTARWLATEPRPAGTGPYRREGPTTPQVPPVPPA